MNPDIEITVGLCVKNAETTIKEAIDSVLSQNFLHNHMELVVVDGHSKDKTLRIIEDSLKNTDVKSRVVHRNKGLGQARQEVVDCARGKYIVWVDSDMVLSRTYVRELVEFMRQNPKAGIAKGRYGLCRENSLVANLEDIEFALSFEREGEVSSKPLGTSGCIYRAEAIRQIGGFDREFKGAGEDMDAEHRIRAAGWLLYITPSTFYERRRKTWKALWNEYFWHGRGGYLLLRKNRQIVNLCKMLPPVALGVELLRIAAAYRLVRRKVVLFLPFHYTFKRVAWFLGFLRSWFEKK